MNKDNRLQVGQLLIAPRAIGKDLEPITLPGNWRQVYPTDNAQAWKLLRMLEPRYASASFYVEGQSPLLVPAHKIDALGRGAVNFIKADIH